MPTVYDRVRAIVADRLNVAEGDVTPETSFVENLNADSLDLVDLIQALEKEFSTVEMELEISDDDALKLTTVGEAVKYIEQRLARETAAA